MKKNGKKLQKNRNSGYGKFLGAYDTISFIEKKIEI
jgi:hypothetical protein